MTSPANLGMLLLAVWLIVFGLLPILSISNPTIHALVALLAVAAGIAILWQRRADWRGPA